MPYNDIYVRDNFDDTGDRSSGIPYQSPDIIPYQSQQLTIAYAVSTYNGPDIGMDVLAGPGKVNNIWVRAKNLQTQGQETGTVNLYWAPASLLMSPDQWLPHQVSTSGGIQNPSFMNSDGKTSLNYKDVALSNPGFLLTGLPQVQPNEHYCFVAVVTTPNNSIDIPTSLAGNATFADWVQSHPQVAWRNIVLVGSALQQQISNWVFGNLDSSDRYVNISVTAEGMPTGTTVRIQSTDHTCAFDQTGTFSPPAPTGLQICSFNVWVPGGYTGGWLTLTLTSPTSAPLPAGNVSVTYNGYPSQTPSELEQRVLRPVTVARDHGAGPVIETEDLIPLGEGTLVLPSAT